MSEQREWPSNGVEFNRWYTGLGRFISVLKHFAWIKKAEFKYVNIRIDTRNGNFIVMSDEKDGERRRVDPNEIAQHVDMKLVDEPERERRTGEYLLKVARSLGWNDDGEGAYEFMMRRCREVAFEDCGRDPSKDLRRVLEQMKKLYRETATYEGGYAITTGALLDFIKEIEKCLTSKT
jgi:hypothetical protein